MHRDDLGAAPASAPAHVSHLRDHGRGKRAGVHAKHPWPVRVSIQPPLSDLSHQAPYQLGRSRPDAEIPRPERSATRIDAAAARRADSRTSGVVSLSLAAISVGRVVVRARDCVADRIRSALVLSQRAPRCSRMRCIPSAWGPGDSRSGKASATPKAMPPRERIVTIKHLTEPRPTRAGPRLG